MRKRATEAETTQMGRMGAEDPVGISGRTLRVWPHLGVRGEREGT